MPKTLTHKILPYIAIGLLTLTSGCNKDFFAKCRVLKKLDSGIDNYSTLEERKDLMLEYQGYIDKINEISRNHQD